MFNSSFSETINILPSHCDFSGRLGVVETFKLFMDIAFLHADSVGIGQLTLMKKNLFWMTVKTSVKYYRRPAMGEKIEIYTWPLRPDSHKSDRCYRITDGKDILVEGRTQWVIFDLEKKAIVPSKDIFDDKFDYLSDTVSIGDYPKINISGENTADLGKTKVGSMDIDIGKHMNNTSYVRSLLDMFSSKELGEKEIGEISVVFKSSAHENDVLDVRTCTIENGLDCSFIFEDGKPSFLARILYK